MVIYDAVDITTASDGTATAYTGRTFTGYLLSVQYIKTDFADGVDITITNEAGTVTYYTGTNVNASALVHPRAQVHGTTGTGLTYDGTRTVCEKLPLAGDRVKVAIAQGGDTKTGTIIIVADGQ